MDVTKLQIESTSNGLDTKSTHVSEKMSEIIAVVKKKHELESILNENKAQERLKRMQSLKERAKIAVVNLEKDLSYICKHKEVLDQIIRTAVPATSINMPYSQQKNFVAEMEKLATVCNETEETLQISKEDYK